MFGPFSIHIKFLFCAFVAASVLLIYAQNVQLYAACRGEGYMGISSKDPIMSWVDLTSSPVYTSASTSGTSGCKNWEFSQYLERTRRQFIKKSQRQLLVETVQGYGPHLDALSKLMTCPETSSESFSAMLWEHRLQTVQIFSSTKQTPEFLAELKNWIKANPDLRNTCGMS